MSYVLSSKPYKTSQSLIRDLKNKNLSFHDEQAAENLLNQISYYHFKIYLHPLLDTSIPNNKLYKANTFFEDGIQLYRFDEELRSLLFKVIARIEVKLRSRLDHTMSSLNSDPFWYLDNQYFYCAKTIDQTRDRISLDFNRENELYAKNFREKYYNDRHHKYKNLPPFWISSELISLGQIYRIYDSINFQISARYPNVLNKLAAEFGAPNYKVLVNWIQCIRNVRNRCAHHSRVWNAKLTAPSKINPLLTFQPAKANRPYGSIAALQIMLKTLGINDITLKNKLNDLFNQYPFAKLHMADAGFPLNWDTDTIWV
ncbi:Abi family protein [Providencia manganoxydans]|uniref:Abi family protein n=1 Tax=Providencia manganoxydans TaxID=2923283 RepID=UPI002853D92C|nr:Abi family protein [Providencia stuartii]